jgi:hypothetical protein
VIQLIGQLLWNALRIPLFTIRIKNSPMQYYLWFIGYFHELFQTRFGTLGHFTWCGIYCKTKSIIIIVMGGKFCWFWYYCCAANVKDGC